MEIVSRAAWGAASEQRRPAMRLPATAVWLHHSVTAVSDDPRKDMRLIQRVGISRFGYLSYSYAVHPNGTVLEGQGTNVGAHTAGRNSTSFGVVLIGNYDQRVVTPEQLNATRWLVAELVRRGHLRPGTYPTGGHRDAPGAATRCPGDWAHRVLSEFRRPWTSDSAPEVSAMPDNPDLPNFAAPFHSFHPCVDQNGVSQGYYMVSESGEVHTHGPGAVYYGRSEEPGG